MFIHQNNRFHFGPVSFALPDGVILDMESQSGFELYVPHHKLEVAVCFRQTCENAPYEITCLLSCDTGFRLKGAIESVTYDGLRGYHGVMENLKTVCEKYVFDLHGETNILDICATVRKERLALDAPEMTRVLAALLESLRYTPITSHP